MTHEYNIAIIVKFEVLTGM